MQNLMFRLSGTPGRIRFPGRRLGQDTAAVSQEWLRLDDEDPAKIRDEGVL